MTGAKGKVGAPHGSRPGHREFARGWLPRSTRTSSPVSWWHPLHSMIRRLLAIPVTSTTVAAPRLCGVGIDFVVLVIVGTPRLLGVEIVPVCDSIAIVVPHCPALQVVIQEAGRIPALMPDHLAGGEGSIHLLHNPGMESLSPSPFAGVGQATITKWEPWTPICPALHH